MTIQEFRQKRKKAGVCRDCGKEDAYTMAGRTYCFDCAEKARLRKERDRQDPEKKERMLAQHRAMVQRRKEAGLCTACGKPKPDDGYVKCAVCRTKQARYKSKKTTTKHGTWTMRVSGDACFCCGAKPIEGKKVCPECMKRLMQNLIKSNPNAEYKNMERYLQPNGK